MNETSPFCPDCWRNVQAALARLARDPHVPRRKGWALKSDNSRIEYIREYYPEISLVGEHCTNPQHRQGVAAKEKSYVT